MEISEQRKVLLVGAERNCRSIGFVLDFKNYELIERLTIKNYSKYKDYQIYVCELKKKSKTLIQHRVLKGNLSIQYLDDICRMIDEDYTAKHEKTKLAVVQQPTTLETNTVIPKVKELSPQEKRPLLIVRIIRGMRHPLRAAWHVVLRLKLHVKHFIKSIKKNVFEINFRTKEWFKITKYNLKRSYQQKRTKYNVLHYKYKKIDLNYRNYLCGLLPSELLLYVMRAPVNLQICCTRLEEGFDVKKDGFLYACTNTIVPFGNLLTDVSVDAIYNSYYARIVKLSSINRSYCLCDICGWCIGYCLNKTSCIQSNWQIDENPKRITLSFDDSCNLACKSCRNGFCRIDDATHQRMTMITNKLLESGVLDNVEHLDIAGQGEVFYSPHYRQLLMTNLQRKQIYIKSNGILLNKNNWQLIANKYSEITIEISVDAASAETYENLRCGGKFDILMENLKMISKLRQQNQIICFNLMFLVQRCNFREMPIFVELGRKLRVDHIQFQRLTNWGNFKQEEYLKQCLIIDNKFLDYELWSILQNPIFQDPIVDLRRLRRYIDASNEKYRGRYIREQRKQSACFK